jgi:hypothetical protein
MYQTSEEGMREIRYALLRQESITELEMQAREENTGPNKQIARQILREAYEKVFGNCDINPQLNLENRGFLTDLKFDDQNFKHGESGRK